MGDTTASVTRIVEVDVKLSATAAAHIKEIADRMKPLESAARNAGDGISTMLSGMKGFVGLYFGEKVREVVGEFVALNDQARQLTERMKLVTSNSSDAGAAFGEIIRIASAQGRELDGVAKLYERVTRSSQQLAISQRGVALITEGFAASLRLSGASAQEASASMTQFSQALASGKLGGDEFRSLMENNSVFMQELSKSMGTTMGGLREMSKEGKLSSETLRTAMLGMGADGMTMLERLMEQAGKLPKTFAQAKDGASAALVNLLEAMQETAEKSEGFFTRMVRAVQGSMNKAAGEIREYAMVQAEVARLMGKPTDKQLEIPDDSARSLRLLASRSQAEETLRLAQRKSDEAAFAQRDNPNFAKSQMWINLNRNTIEAEARLNVVNKLLSEIASKDSGDTIGGLVTGKPAKAKDKIKHQGLDSLETLSNTFSDELEAKMGDELGQVWDTDVRSDKSFVKLMGKHMTAVLKAVSESKMDMNSVAFKDLRTNLIDNARRLDDQDTELSFQKLTRGSLDKDMDRQVQHTLDEIKANKERVKHYLEAERRLNPLVDEEDEANEVKRLISFIMDGATPETLAKAETEIAALTRYLGELRLKMAKKIMGEKNSEKGIGDQLADEFGQGLDRMEDRLLQFTGNWKEALNSFVTDFFTAWAKIELRQATQPLMEAGKEFIKGLFGSANGSSFGAGGVRAFAAGGVVNEPTGFRYGADGRNSGVMGEAGPEAIMPLRRGADGKLGVGATPVTVNVYNNASNTKTKQEETTDSNGNRQINIIIEEAVQNGFASGKFDKTLNSQFGVSRKGAR
jgi:tape measure domain-containing protein